MGIYPIFLAFLLRRRRLFQIGAIAEPTEQRIVNAVPNEKDRFTDPKRSLVDLVDRNERVDVIEDENVVQNGKEEGNGTVDGAWTGEGR